MRTFDVAVLGVGGMGSAAAYHLARRGLRILAARVCLYTNSPDGHFIVDRHPRNPNVTIAAGFSGHGFKFCSVIGEILADLVQGGRTRHDVDLFRLSRFAPSA